MRVLEDLKINSDHMEMIENIKFLPDRAKELIVATLDYFSQKQNVSLADVYAIPISNYSECESPIEKILYVASDIVFYLRETEIIERIFLNIQPQYKIQCKENTYKVDFLITIETLFPYRHIIRGIIVECDGYDFHQKTKQQVKNDNERELELKMLGYDVLRFSGTQIYENPIKCANDIFDYVLTKIKK